MCMYIYIYIWMYAVLCLVAQLCLTLCDPMACSPPGSSVHGDSPGKNTVHMFLKKLGTLKNSIKIMKR